jgi:tyrosine-protein kinase Etk/Wzc
MRNYIRYWYFILLGAIVGLTGAYLYLRYVAIPKYSITSSILIREEGAAPTLSGLTNTSSEELLKPKQSVDNEVQLLRSRSLMLRVVEELALYASYYTQPNKPKTELYEKNLPVAVSPLSTLQPTAYEQSVRVFPKADSSFTLQEGTTTVGTYRLGQQITRPYGTLMLVPTLYFSTQVAAYPQGIAIVFSNPQDVAEDYNQLLTVSSANKDASVLNLSLISPVPAKGRDIMNKLLQVYNKEAVEDKNEASASKLTFLDRRIKSLGSELSGVEQSVESYQRQQGIADVGTQTSSNVEQESALQTKLNDWATQIQVLQSIENYLNSQNSQYRLVPSTLGIQDQTLLGLINQFNGLQVERERLLRTNQENNPLVLTTNEQLAGLRTKILENLRNIKNGLIITSRNLQNSSGQVRAKINSAPVVQRTLQAKERERSLRQNIYLYLMQKREEAALALSATVSNSRVIDPATVSDLPVSPNRKMTYLLGLLLGMGLPLSLLYAKGQLNNKVETKAEIEELTTTPILGEIARKRGGSTVVVSRDNRSALAEMFGLVRANLNFATAGRENKVTLITSTVPGEGKSFISINLSNSLVVMGKKVVLLDLDLRKPSIAHELSVRTEPGITDYLVSDRLAIDDILQTSSSTPGLFIISAGSMPPNPAELLASPKLAFLLQELAERFDHILIDTPPIGLVADAFSLAPLANSTICVVRYNYTQREHVKAIEALYANKKFNSLMLVLNDSRTSVSNYYGYGYDKAKSPKNKQQVEI